MHRKPLYAALVAAAFAFPLAAGANTGDKAKDSSASSAKGSADDGGAESMFATLDKNKDGFLSKDEVKGTPHEVDFASLDKNGDGKLSRDEHYNAKEHVAARGKAGGATGNTSSSSANTPSGKKSY